jgi:tripartite-type tricarboxylate transporter receptor subunit TctC
MGLHKRRILKSDSGLATLLLSAIVLCSLSHAGMAEDFYRGKTLSLVIGSDVSGEYTAGGRIIAKHLGNHLPGNPAIITQNMPGASSIKAANYLYSVAPKDGLTFGLVSKDVPIYEATTMHNVNYKSRDFIWLGSLSGSNNLVVVWAATGIKTLDDAKQREVIMGALGANGTLATYPFILNNLFGTKFKVVLGYTGAQLVDLAMERGEVEGRGSYSWSDMKRARTSWLKDGKFSILAQFGLKKEPDLPDVPLVTDLTQDPKYRAALEFICSDTVMARPFLLPPDTVAKRAQLMKRAFDATMTDPDFLADARQSQVDVSPIGADELTNLVNRTVGTGTDIVRVAEQLMIQPPSQKAR